MAAIAYDSRPTSMCSLAIEVLSAAQEAAGGTPLTKEAVRKKLQATAGVALSTGMTVSEVLRKLEGYELIRIDGDNVTVL